MSSYPAVTFTSNTTTYLITVHRKRDLYTWLGTFAISGTFGGGTLKLQLSLDGGTTKLDLEDFSGTPYSTTTSATFNVQLGGGSKVSDAPIIYGVLSGATNPSITVQFVDNN